MFTFLVVTTSILFLLLLIAAAMRPVPSDISIAELERRAKRGSKEAKASVRRERYLNDVISLLRVKTAALLVATVLLSVVAFGWVIGSIAGVFVALFYGALSRMRPIVLLSEKLYILLEPSMIRAAEKFPIIFSFIRSAPTVGVDAYRRFDSREELQELISQSGDILTADERNVIVSALGFRDQQVKSVMTPKTVVDTIKKSEFLGPLVLDELHQLGHSRLPVIDKDIDHVVGILHLRDLLSLDIKRSATAEKAMEPKVFYIRYDQSLEHALAAFLKTRHHLFIVINEARETLGIVTLEDVIEAMIGRRIMDEDDNHADLRAIAAGRRGDNNSPEKYQDV